MRSRRRSIVAAAVGTAVALAPLAGAGTARAQVPEDTTTTTTAEEPLPTTVPAPDDLAPTTTVPPAPYTTTTTTAPRAAAPATTTTAPAPAAPPAVGGDAPAPPPGALPPIPPELQARIDSVERTGSNSTVRLLEALAPLRAMGMTDQEAVQAGFGRFPVGGRATFTDDWWFPRFVPAVHLHEGSDIFAPYGTPARSPADGVLVQTFNPVGGLSAYVHQTDGTYFYLAHLSRYEAGQVSGQAVRAGDVIGYVGDSGNARGSSPHVHFEVHPRGRGPVNPKPLLDAWLAEALGAVPRVVAEAAPRLASRAAAVAPEEQDLVVVGHSALGGGGGYGDVAVVGDTALVARGTLDPGAPGADPAACQGSVSVVDLAEPDRPAEAAAIDLPPGQRVEDVAGMAVRSPAFTGDLAALVVAPCQADGATGIAYYDVTDRERPRLLGRVAHPRELSDAAGAGPSCAERLRGTCPRTVRTVELRRDGPGRILSLSSATGASGRLPGVYAVEITDPAAPRAIGWLAGPGHGRATAGHDCAPLVLEPPQARPQGLPGMADGAGFRWATEPEVATGPGPGGTPGPGPVVAAGGRTLALVADEAWWSSTWAVRVDPPAAVAGDKEGCAGALPGRNAGAGPTAGGLVYVGRGCPERRAAGGAAVPADPYLADPSGRIAVADAALDPLQPDLGPVGCTPEARLDRARAAGARGLVVAGSFLAGDEAGDEAGAAPADAGGAGLRPAVQRRQPGGDALRRALWPPAP
ncbi:MAG: peptidoglycan DD-metalloendopeptidase family protein, partial [Actinomycetota bacterium]